MKKKFIKKFKKIKGFTLIELIIGFAIIGVLTAVSLASFGSYTSSQTFGTGVSEFSNFLSITRSKAISQVKPSVCGSSPLGGYRVIVTISGSNYEQDVVCGGINYTITQKKLPGQLTFASGSVGSIKFDVSTGTVMYPGDIAISGFGKTSTFAIDKIGNISLNSGLSVTPMPTEIVSTPIPTTSITSTPTPTPGVTITVPTPTPTSPPAGSTNIVITSISPNPATKSQAQTITFTATVTGTNCTPSGAVYFYKDSDSTYFTAGSLSGANPGVATASYNSYPLTVGTHSIYARLAAGGNCPTKDSSIVTLTIN